MNKSLRLAMETPEHAPAPVAGGAGTGAQTPYAQDALERWVLFLFMDKMRSRPVALRNLI